MKKQDQKDLFITAIEGGSNYWLLLDATGLKTERKKPEPLSEYLFRAVWEGEIIRVLDCDDGLFLGLLSKESFSRGSALLKSIRAVDYEEVVKGYFDASTADIWLQLCVMGTQIYG